MTIKNIKILLLTAAAAAGLDASAVELTTSPGRLQTQLQQLGEISDGALVLKGHCDVRDLMQLASLPASVKTLDLSGVTVDEYSASENIFENRSYFKANELPCYIFFKSPADKIVCPTTLKRIDDGAFAGAEALEIQLPEGLQEIGAHVFYDCASLRSIKLPASLRTLGMWAFARCSSLADMDMSSTNVTSLEECTFTGCSSLQNVTLPASLVSIGKEVFSGTGIRSLNLQNIRHADDYALVGMTQLEEVSLASSADMGQGLLMANTNLRSISGMPVDLPRLFAANCNNLEIATSLQGVNTAGEYSLAGTKGKVIVLGKGLARLEKGALRNIIGLREIHAGELGADVPEADEAAFEGIDCPAVTLAVDDDAVDTWKNDPVWSRFSIIRNSELGVDEIVADADDINVAFGGGVLEVSSSAPIQNIDVYNLDGRHLFTASPNISYWSRDMNDCTEKIIMVRVATPDVVKTFKLSLR